MAFAPAKINLFLHVTGRAEHGYHHIESLMLPLAFGDAITVQLVCRPMQSVTEEKGSKEARHGTKSTLATINECSVLPAQAQSAARDTTLATDFSLEIIGDAALASEPPEKNLVLKAARALQKKLGTPHAAHFTLKKQIPHAAGLGGGSSDAAATLRALLALWQQELPEAALLELATALGADVPFFLKHSACYAEGIGEILTPVALPKLHLLLVKPDKAVATEAVFRAGFSQYRAPVAMPPVFADVAALVSYLTPLHNDLTANACALAPEIAAILATLSKQKDCLLARMSGSGATCFGIFATAEAAQAAAAYFPECWTCATHSA